MGTMTIDNFAAIRSHLRFDNPGDIYVVHIMIRGKDIGDEQKKIFREDHQSGLLVKTYYIDSLEYFDKKRPAMIDLANQNKARVYFTMTRKNRITCNRIILKKLVDEVDNPNVRYDHLIRSAVCGCHISDYKWWTLDVDNDTEITKVRLTENLAIVDDKIRLIDIKDKLIIKMAELVDETGTRSGSEIFEVPTKNGCHVMTPPFNRSKLVWLGDNLKADAMTLAYFQWED